MPIDLKVVPIAAPTLRDDPVAFLRALADDIESGATENYEKAVLIVDNGKSYQMWSFGPGTRNKLETLGLLQVGVGLQFQVVTEGG